MDQFSKRVDYLCSNEMAQHGKLSSAAQAAIHEKAIQELEKRFKNNRVRDFIQASLLSKTFSGRQHAQRHGAPETHKLLTGQKRAHAGTPGRKEEDAEEGRTPSRTRPSKRARRTRRGATAAPKTPEGTPAARPGAGAPRTAAASQGAGSRDVDAVPTTPSRRSPFSAADVENAKTPLTTQSQYVCRVRGAMHCGLLMVRFVCRNLRTIAGGLEGLGNELARMAKAAEEQAQKRHQDMLEMMRLLASRR